MKLLREAHRSRFASLSPTRLSLLWSSLPVLSGAIISARFLLNRSFSRFANFSFRFIAPGRLFRLLCLIIASLTAMSPFFGFGASGRATARESRLVTNFFEGLRRFFGVALVFSMREMRAECLMVRLSFLDVIPNIPRSFPPSFLPSFDGVLADWETGRLESLLPAVGLVGACKLSAVEVA